MASDTIVVVDEESSVNLAGNESGTRIQLALNHGKAGFRQVPRGTELEVRAGRSTVRIRANENDTEFGVDFLQSRARIIVREGSVRIQDQVVEKGKGGVARAANPGLFVFAQVKDFEDVKWLKKPQSRSVIPSAFRMKLVKSGDVQMDLKKLLQSNVPLTQSTAARMYLSLNNGSDILRIATSGDVDIQRGALEWLLGLNTQDPRSQRVWAEIQTGAIATFRQPVVLPQMVGWSELPIGRRLALPKKDLDGMIALLKHPVWFYRQLAVHYLGAHYPNRTGYRSDLPVTQLRTAATRWEREILATQRNLPR